MIHARSDYNRIQDPAQLIPADEPVFLVRAKDVCAPETVLAWASLAESVGAAPNIIEAARKHAQVMIEWQKSHQTQVPDMPPKEPPDDHV